MKKILALPIAAMLVIGVMSGCGSNAADTPAATPAPAVTDTATPAPAAATPAPAAPATPADTAEAAPADTTATAAAGTLKTGLGIVTAISGSNAAADAAGNVEVDSTVVGVLVDDSGKITDCKIDVAQTNVPFDATGAITADLTAPQQTKDQKKEGYGMAKASAIGKEWYQQAEAFAEYAIGKTADEITGMATVTNAEGSQVATDLTTSCTIGISDFQAAIAKAVANAQPLGANAGDKLGLGTVTSLASSTSATADAAGLAEVDSYYSVSTFGADNKVTSCVIDASQAKTNIDATGAITSDMTAPVQSKDELKEGYGMAKASAIGQEWYQQAAAFADYAKGKTADEINGIATTTNAEGSQVAADLTTSCTVGVGDFQGAITNAFSSVQ